MDIPKWVAMCIAALIPYACQAMQPHQEALENLKQFNVISDYDDDLRLIEINRDSVFVFGDTVKILIFDKIFVPLKYFTVFDDRYYVSYEYFSYLCKDINKYVSEFVYMYPKVSLVDYKHGMSPPSSKELAKEAAEAALEFLVHSTEAALALNPCPPLACYQMYKAKESAGESWDKLKEAYDAYKKEESEKHLEALKDMTKKED